MPHYQEAKLPQNIPSENRRSKQGSMRDCQEGQSGEQLPSATNNSALQTAVNATEPRYAHARSTDTIEAELKLHRPISPSSSVRSGSGRELIFQTPGQSSQTASRAAEGATSAIKSATLTTPCGISDGTKIAGSTMRSAPGERENDHVKRATSPAEGPPNTSKTGNEAAGALEFATRLHALLSELPKVGVTDKDAEGDAVHCEKEHDNANVTAEGSIIPRARLRMRASTPDSLITLPTHIRQISVESRYSSQPGDDDEESGSTTTKATSHDGELSPHVEDQQTWEIFIGLGGSVPDDHNS